MNWQDIVGQQNIKNLLEESIDDNRISHAQLFVGKDGYGTLSLALAYAKEILSRENPVAGAKVDHLNHLDLHFSFPVFTENKNTLSKRLFQEFRRMILENPYSNFEDFTQFLQSENKQFFISTDEVEEIAKKFSLKSFEGGSKILIIWRAEKMRVDSANKILKFLEEPPAKTIILLISENTDFILPTILSRAQITEVPRIEDQDIEDALKKNPNVNKSQIAEIVHQSQGNYNIALKLANSENTNTEFETLFVEWVRSAFMVKNKPEYLKNIINWAKEISVWNREKQKQFLDFCSEIFRLALIHNYSAPSLVYKKLVSNGFQWEKFIHYIHGANIESILGELSMADYHLERNGNSKIVWTDMGIKLTRYIHRRAS